MKIVSKLIEVKDGEYITIIPIDSEFENEKEKYKDTPNTMVVII